MYTEGQKKAKVGVVTVDIHGSSYRLRFVYPEGSRHQFSIAKVSPEGWTTAIKAAQLVDRDINLGDFDDTYARYSPKHARKLKLAQSEAKREYNLKELWELYKEASKDRVAKTTIKNKWNPFDKYLETLDAKVLLLSNAESFIRLMLQRYTLSTVKGLFSSTLMPAINFAIYKKFITENPYSGVSLGKSAESPIECFEPNEIKAIIAAFYSDNYCSNKSAYSHSHYAPMVEFLALTGCRPEECHALTWEDIKAKNGKTFIRFDKAYSNGILLPYTKNHTIRLFLCNKQLEKLIRQVPRVDNSNNLIFPSSKLAYVNQGNFRQRYWKPVLDGLVKDGKIDKYLKPYCLRHSFITRLVREGVDIATVASLSGNSPEIIMKNYLASRKEFDLPEL